MSGQRTAAGASRFEVRASSSDHFAWIRTRLSVERTMMSWLRTAVALIGFGFAIVQYLNHLQQIPEARPANYPTAPEYLGLALISSGIVALVISIWQYWRGLRYLWGEPSRRSPALRRKECRHRSLRSPCSWSSLASSRSVPCCCASPSQAGQPASESTFDITAATKGN